MHVDGRVVVITGGSRGIGAATAKLAAERGYRVAIAYRVDHAAADAVVRTIEAAGGEAVALEANVASERDVERLFETVDARMGRVDALVNNAAILDRQMPLVDMSAERIVRTLAVNVVGPFICSREAVRRMSTARGGRGAPSSMCRRGQPNTDHRTSMSITRPPKAADDLELDLPALLPALKAKESCDDANCPDGHMERRRVRLHWRSSSARARWSPNRRAVVGWPRRRSRHRFRTLAPSSLT
jgi:hypothetical protein